MKGPPSSITIVHHSPLHILKGNKRTLNTERLTTNALDRLSALFENQGRGFMLYIHLLTISASSNKYNIPCIDFSFIFHFARSDLTLIHAFNYRLVIVSYMSSLRLYICRLSQLEYRSQETSFK